MGTMRTSTVSKWLRNRGEVKTASVIDQHCTAEHTDTEEIQAIIYLTTSSRRSTKLFREMECDVVTYLPLNLKPVL